MIEYFVRYSIVHNGEKCYNCGFLGYTEKVSNEKIFNDILSGIIESFKIVPDEFKILDISTYENFSKRV